MINRRYSRAGRRKERSRIWEGDQEVSATLGHLLEQRVADLLTFALDRELILGVGHTKPYSREDISGIDLYVVDCKGQRHNLQVKSSVGEASSFRCEHPDIPVILVRPSEPPFETVKKLERLFPFLKGLGKAFKKALKQSSN